VFKVQRERADKTDAEAERDFYRIMVQIGEEASMFLEPFFPFHSLLCRDVLLLKQTHRTCLTTPVIPRPDNADS
jgi:hypothetical protein